MQIWVGGRRWGKTYRLMEWLRSPPEGVTRIIVAHSRYRAMQLCRENLDMESWQFVSLDELQDRFPGLRGRGRIEVAIDDLDLVLPALFGADVVLATATGVVMPKPPDFDETHERLVRNVGPKKAAAASMEWPES